MYTRLLIVAMAAGAFMLWRREPRYGLAFLGSLSFIVSDLLLGNQLFRSPASLRWAWSLRLHFGAVSLLSLQRTLGV